MFAEAGLLTPTDSFRRKNQPPPLRMTARQHSGGSGGPQSQRYQPAPTSPTSKSSSFGRAISHRSPLGTKRSQDSTMTQLTLTVDSMESGRVKRLRSSGEDTGMSGSMDADKLKAMGLCAVQVRPRLLLLYERY